MSKKLIIVCVALVLALIGTKLGSEEKKTVGILQTASHPALDQAKEEFTKELKRLDPEIHFVVQNAEGSLTAARSSAELFHSQKKIKLIFAIGTPAAQAAATTEKEKPLVFTAITDPAAAGLENENICGTTDRVDTDAQAKFIRKRLPNLKTIAILYNPVEANSAAQVKSMQKSLEKEEIHYLLFGVHSENEISQTIITASQKVQALLIPADNLLVGAMPLVSKEALKRALPVIASDIPSVEKGAFAAQGADYGDLGIKSAALAHEILQGMSPKEVGIHHPEESKVVINESILKELKL